MTSHLSPIEEAVCFGNHENTSIISGPRTVAVHLATLTLFQSILSVGSCQVVVVIAVVSCGKAGWEM